MVKGSDMNMQSWMIVATMILPWSIPSATAGILSAVDGALAKSSHVSERSLKAVLTNNELYSQIAKDLLPNTGARLTATAFKEAFRADLVKFALGSSEKKILWERKDIVELVTKFQNAKCSVNVSCQVAMDLVPSQTEDFVDGISKSIDDSIEKILSDLSKKSDQLNKELVSLSSQNPERSKKLAELAALEKEYDRVRPFDEASNRLARPLSRQEIDELQFICK